MQKLQDAAFTVLKTTSLSPAVFSYLQPTEDFTDVTPLGGILSDSKHGWLALGPKFCVIDLRNGLKVAAYTFGVQSNIVCSSITSVIELPTPLTENSKQLVISVECEDHTGLICVFHINGSQILRCIQTELTVTNLAICDAIPEGLLSCFDGVVIAGVKSGEIVVFDLNRSALIQALEYITQGYIHQIRNEANSTILSFLPIKAINKIRAQRQVALDNDDHLALLLNENSLDDTQYNFHNPDGSTRMIAKKDHVRVSTIHYIPQLGSVAVGFNFGAFQIWNLMMLELEFTSQVNVECLPVTQFGFQEPCDDPRAFCYLWVIYSTIDRFEDEEFPLAVMYSLTYQGKKMLSDTKYLYKEFLSSNIRFQIELSVTEGMSGQFNGGRCVSCHTYSINTNQGEDSDDSMLNICQLIWECWSAGNNNCQYGMLLFDLDQWYKDQMPATYQMQNTAFMSVTSCGLLTRSECRTLDLALDPASIALYSHAERLEEHFYPNSLQYNCICLNTSEVLTLNTVGVQRQLIGLLQSLGEEAILNPQRVFYACLNAGLSPLYAEVNSDASLECQRRFVLSLLLQRRQTPLLLRLAQKWAKPNSDNTALPNMLDWCWRRAVQLKENAQELTAPLFTTSSLPDRNVIRCLEDCVRQLIQLTDLLDGIMTKCCNLVVPDALSEIEEKLKCVSAVCLYFRVLRWLLSVGLLPERQENSLSYPATYLTDYYHTRRKKLHRLEGSSLTEEESCKRPCNLLYIDQLIVNECGGELVHDLWRRSGSENFGLYPPPSLYSLLRLFLQTEIADEHKHSIVLYLLVDYTMYYDQVRYEPVIRRLMQFPTVFGLSNTTIKATQAFWHLDHRDFDFALDQLQCLTGNALSTWQHHIALNALLTQNKTQQALQYLHVRKPIHDGDSKVSDWQVCCDLYIARGLIHDALQVIRMCMELASSEDKVAVMEYFLKGCRKTGQLSKLLETTLSPFEEQSLVKHLQEQTDRQSADLLIMYYLQQARYLEAQQYNYKLKKCQKESTLSTSSLDYGLDKDSARENLIDIVCATLPNITSKVASCANHMDMDTNVVSAKPMSVFVQAKSPKNTYTYKSSFIQDTIENASETWLNKPKLRSGLKRALNIEDTPFLCTPRVNKNIRSSIEHSPPKRAKLDLMSTPVKPKVLSTPKVNEHLDREMRSLLQMPDVQSPPIWKMERSREATPQSILKVRRRSTLDISASPVNSQYLDDTEEELMETASNHTHASDSTSKHLRFTIPKDRSPSEESEMEPGERESFICLDNTSSIMIDSPSIPPRKNLVADRKIEIKKNFKDNVRGRLSLSNSLTDDPSASVESIADLSITILNPKYTSNRRSSRSVGNSSDDSVSSLPKTPSARKPLRRTDAVNRSRSVTPERLDSPFTRSRSRTPELSPLSSIVEQPKQETDEPQSSSFSAIRQLRTRSKSRTPERSLRVSKNSTLKPIDESPTKGELEEKSPSPTKRISRSRTPEMNDTSDTAAPSPKISRNIPKTPERTKGRKSLTRMVLEQNTFTKTQEDAIQCTPMKNKEDTSFLDFTFSPIVDKSVLNSPDDSSADMSNQSTNKSFHFKTLNETDFDKSVLKTYVSSIGDSSKVSMPNASVFTNKSVLRDVSSLITDDSEAEEKVDKSSEVVEKIDAPKDIYDFDEDSSSDQSSSSSENDGQESKDEVISVESTDESESSKLQIDETSQPMNVHIEHVTDSVDQSESSKMEVDPLQAASLLTDDNSTHDDHEIVLNYSDDGEAEQDPKIASHQAEDVAKTQKETEPLSSVESVKQSPQQPKTEETSTAIDKDQKMETPKRKRVKSTSNAEVSVTPTRSRSLRAKSVQLETEIIEVDEKIPEKKLRTLSRRTKTPDRRAKTPEKAKSSERKVITPERAETPERKTKTPERKAKTPDRKAKTPERKAKTPERRLKTPDRNLKTPEVETPEQKTPSQSPERTGRKILTRRVSKELNIATESPKSIDDNSSVSSGSTMKSNVETSEVKRRGRKSILPSKPDLSAIPEISTDDFKEQSQFMDYSSSRRLTRNQKSLLQSSIESPGRRNRTTSKTIVEQDDDDDSNKQSFEGSMDSSGADMTMSDINKPRKGRVARANSETKQPVLKPKVTRRGSIDVASLSLVNENDSFDSPRSRRACFTKACEALHTPNKTRRTSTDLKKLDLESRTESPTPSEPTPARRTRRANSTQSNASGKSDTPRRTKKAQSEDRDK